MKIKRLANHLLTTRWQVGRCFPRSTLIAIEKLIKSTEATHKGEIAFAVEGSLDGLTLLSGKSARQRAIELFSELRVWDTEHNNGLLIYVLLADRAVEILADRGIHAKAGAQAWSGICREIEAAFGRSDFEAGIVNGIKSVSEQLMTYFPKGSPSRNELSDKPVVI